MNIGDKIRELRESKGLLQSELAVILGVSDKAVSSWENGNRTPRMGPIEKLANYFQVPKSYFFDDEANKPYSSYTQDFERHADQLANRPELGELLSIAEASSRKEVLQMIRVFRAMKGE